MRIPALFRTGVFQLMLVYIVLFGASVAALFLFLYWTTIGSLERQSESVITAEIRGLEEQWNRRGLAGLVDVIRERVRSDPEGRSVYLLVDPTLRPLAGNMAYWPEQFNRRGEWVSFVKVSPSGLEAPARARVLEVPPGYRLLVGREHNELTQIDQVFRNALIWGVGLTLGLALAGGMLMSFQAQRKVAQINRTTKQIIAGDLSRRVPTTGGRDEYDELANNVNAMLDKIEQLLGGIRHVGDSIAHDLRGPLTRLGNQLEVLAAERQPSREGLALCAAQADALLRTFNALLRISRIESGAYRSAFAELDLAEIVRSVCELYRAAAEERGIALNDHVPASAIVFGDRELLAQALTNLLDNAIKYSPDRGHIDVRLILLGPRVRIRIADDGPGIPESARDRVFERFARLDQSRSHPGNGLGLALVKAVAEQHGGTLTLDDNRPGLIVNFELPCKS